MPVIIASNQTRVKDSVASSPVVGLAVRANGEERTKVIDRNGTVVVAEIPQPTAAPVLGAAAGGTLTYDKYYAYAYVYAAARNYPLVENEFSINGALYPRGNPSPSAIRQVPSSPSANRTITVQVAYSTRVDIDEVWIFRSAAYDTSGEAANAGAAGLLYYVGKIVNNTAGGTGTYNDTNPTQGVDLIENDNYAAPTFQFVVYYDPYWFGFGNHTFYEKVTWDSNGLVTLDASSGKWFDGRNGQFLTLSGITTGGFDGAGGWKFKWVSDTTGYATIDGTNPVTAGTFPVMGVGDQFATLQGPATTIYRSKARNPFAWGWTRVIGTLRSAQIWALKVGGGLGTAIAVVPNEPILKLDCEMPAKCFSFNLQAIDNYDNFRKTRRIVSDVFSITSHHSQFAAMTPQGLSVLWGIDYKNFAILQSNGISQTPISGAVPRILRELTRDRSRQLLSHGLYDPYTQLNCLWVTTEDSVSLVNFLIFQHAPTGFWGFMEERDILCSASIPDPTTGEIKTLVGTETGLYGQAFAPGTNYNWLPATGLYTGTVQSSTTNSITATEAAVTPFNTVDNGLVGNWCLITDEDDETEQWARIASVTADTLVFDIVIANDGSSLTQFSPLPTAGFKFYIGLIECRLTKLFDLQLPATDKKFVELWLTQQGVDEAVSTTLIRVYRERERDEYIQQFTLNQSPYETGEQSDVWYKKTSIPSELMKSFGVEIINRGYAEWRIYNYLMKVDAVP